MKERRLRFYHIKNLQSTKTVWEKIQRYIWFYHIKNLQSTKTNIASANRANCFITLRIYKVLKLRTGGS